jgi:hypothetical protein
MKNKTLACFFHGAKKVCTGDFETVLHRSFGLGVRRKSRKSRKRRRR